VTLDNKKLNDRVRASVYPTNRIIFGFLLSPQGRHGIRQVAFPYTIVLEKMSFLYFSIGKKKDDSVSVPSKLLGGKKR